MISLHTTNVLSYSSIAGMCNKEVLPTSWAVIPPFRSIDADPLTSQANVTPLALVLQLKVAVDPRVALTDVGMFTNAEI